MVRDKLFSSPGVHLLGTEPSEWTWDLPLLEVSGSGLGHTRYTGPGSVFFCLGSGSVQREVTSALMVPGPSEATLSSANRAWVGKLA